MKKEEILQRKRISKSLLEKRQSINLTKNKNQHYTIMLYLPCTGSCGTSKTNTEIAAALKLGEDIPNAMVV